MSTYKPGIEMQRRIVALLRADTTLSNTTTGLLFAGQEPQVNGDDTRVYSVEPFLPADGLTTLPRVLIEVMQWANDYEQDAPILVGPLKVWTRTVVRQGEEQLGGQIDAYLATLLLSTWLSDARIIAARLSADGTDRRQRINEFDGAWEFVSGFATPQAGSLQ